MSSAQSAAVGGATAVSPTRKSFFCHQCNQNVYILVYPSSDPFCPHCNDGFVEECDEPNPNPTRFRISHSSSSEPFSSFLPFLLPPSSSATHTTTTPSSFSVVDLLNHGLFSNPFPSPPGIDRPEDPFDPFAFLQSHLHNLSSSGAHIQFVIDNRSSEGGGFRLPANLGDYFIGPGLEQLIQQLAENDPNRYGTPPASKSAVEQLPTVKVTDEVLNSEMNQCAVCQDDFQKDMEVKQMPCKHIYHVDCLLPWLELHNSCPVCRYELPTDDSDYENRRGGAQVNAQVGENGGRGENRTVRRTFSIRLPYPFRENDGSEPGSDGRENTGV